MEISTLFNYLSVHIDGQTILIPVESVIEVTKQKINRTLPGLKKGFIGITDLRHEIIPVFSLYSTTGNSQDLVILKVKDKKIGFMTDKVDTISMLDIGESVPNKIDEFILSVNEVTILDVESIGKVLD